MGQSYKLEQHFILTESELLKLIKNKSISVGSVVDLGEVNVNNELLSLVSYLDNNKYDNSKLGLINSYKG